MRIHKDNNRKITFKTRYSYFNYQIIFFRLTNASAIFKGYMNKILVNKLDIFVITILDDIFIYIENKKKYVDEAV